MAKDKISIKFLIHLVGERPALWDKTSEAYKDRSLKETSWREICTFINENYEHMAPAAKQEFTKMVTKKWTHIRDSWVKSMKYGYDDHTKLPPKPYVYHDELKFLQKVLKYRRRRYDLSATSFERYYDGKQDTNQGSIDDHHEPDDAVKQPNGLSLAVITAEEEVDDDWPLDGMETPTKDDIKREPSQVKRGSETEAHNQRPHLKRPRSNGFIHYEAGASTSRNHKLNLCDNRHWNFFKGIFPSVNTLDEDHTLQFQAGIITLLQQLKASQKQVQKPHTSKRRRRGDANNDLDYEWPIHKVDLSKRYSTRSAKSATDPFAGEGEDDSDGDDSEYCSENF